MVLVRDEEYIVDLVIDPGAVHKVLSDCFTSLAF